MYHIFVFTLNIITWYVKLWKKAISASHFTFSKLNFAKRYSVTSFTRFSFRCTCTINQETLSAISSDENNVNKHTIFFDVRKLFKDRSKSTRCKVLFLTSNNIEYC